MGKSKICEHIAEKYKLTWQDVSKIATKNGFVEEHDDILECPVIDEDKVRSFNSRSVLFDCPIRHRPQLLDFLEPEISKGGNVVEYHGCDFFPERWFDAVFVVRCNNTVLYDRLVAREYNPTKISKNIECEIFQHLLNEARECYADDIVYELAGDSEKDFEESLETISDYLDSKSD